MIRTQLKKLFMPIPDAHAARFRNAIQSDNLTRLIIGGAILTLVELGVYISFRQDASDILRYPLSLLLFNLPMLPLLAVLKKRAGHIRLKQALISLSIAFYLVWSSFFTWAIRTADPASGLHLPLPLYMLMVYGVAIFLYLEPLRGALFFLASFLLFIAIMPYDAVSQKVAVTNAWNTLALNSFAWITSRLIFGFRLQMFLDNRLIQDKNDELEIERNNLKDALANVRHLSGLLPICSNCKKVRDDGGYWQQVERYIEDRSEATFSHSLCPECMKRLYPDMEKS